jgi:hypothetical protein
MNKEIARAELRRDYEASGQFRCFHADQPTAVVNVANMAAPTATKTAVEAALLPSHIAKPAATHATLAATQATPTRT